MMQAKTDYRIHELISARWSPYGYADRDVTEDDLRSLFEAARWAPSSYNEQPWRFILARKADAEHFKKALSCLVEGNQTWAANAPVLVITAISRHFAHNNKPNKAAEHDLGLAVANLSLEATARGLCVHQMIGILPDQARKVFNIPDGYDAHTAFAIGYAGGLDALPDDVAKRDEQRRPRRPLGETVFGASWGKTSRLFS